MNSASESHDRRLQRWANWATILALIIAILAAYIAYLQLIENRIPSDLRMAATLIAIEEEQKILGTALALQTQQGGVPSNNVGATQTAIISEVANIRATSQALSTQAAQIQATLQASVPPFVGVSIKQIANYKMDHLVNPISGEYTFRGIPFTLLSGSETVFQTQNHGLPSLPRSASLEVAIPHPVNVYVLVNGGYVYKSLAGQTAGIIRLSFADGTSVTYNLIVGRNFREHWGFSSGPTPWSGSDEVVTQLDETTEWTNVYRESQSRDNRPAMAYIDMVTIAIPTQNQSSVMTRIDIIDTSVDNFGMLSPSLIVYGITVDTTP